MNNTAEDSVQSGREGLGTLGYFESSRRVPRRVKERGCSELLKIPSGEVTNVCVNVRPP